MSDSMDDRPEKCTRALPQVRVGESLETALMRLASHEERTLSDYIRKALESHVFGHARMVFRATDSRNQSGVMQRNTLADSRLTGGEE